jgi:hypothetical protein
MNKLDVIYGLFVSPAAVIRGVLLGKYLNLALFVVALSVISSSVGWLLIFPQNITPSLFIITLLMGTIFLLLFLFILCGILSIMAGFYGGVGNGRFLYIAACLSLIPYWLVTPSALLISYFEPGGASLLFSLIRIIFFFWSAGLFVISIREIYVFSHGKAIATLLTPAIAAWVLLIVVFILLISIMVPLVGEFFAYLPHN